MTDEHTNHEHLVEALNDETTLSAYKATCAAYHPHLIPRLLAGLFIWCGNIVYGRDPSYQKFRAIEVIARVPYHSWSSAAFTLLTLFYKDEERALRLSSNVRFAEFASENETMHVVVMSQLAQAHQVAGFFRYTLIPALFSFVYFWESYLLYLVNARWALEIKYIFETHAFDQYAQFLTTNDNELRRCPITSDYLMWYGRRPHSEYEFFRSVRNDELVHRGRSIEEITLARTPLATV